jgi:hypothetical protein
MIRSIDIVVPSFSVRKEYILYIIELIRSQDTLIKFYIIIDNSAIIIDAKILNVTNNNHIPLIVNQKSIGTSLVRNVDLDLLC